MSAIDRAPLPEPHEAEQAHSQRLLALILERLAVAPVTFSQYMSMALYEPGAGYYMAGSHKFGAGGDFITAPELSPLFGAALSVQCREVAETLGGHVLELGAGSGRLAASLCLSIGNVDDFAYTILEPSAELQERQQTYLSSVLPQPLFARINWVHELPEGFKGVVIANEVMDALPVERFRVGHSLMQIEVAASNDSSTAALQECEAPASEAIASAVARIEKDLGYQLPPGYCSELCLLLAPWLASLADAIEAGVILLVDYGYPRRDYYMEERSNGTLRCYFRHRAHDDPYILHGIQDITAHVDFTEVATAGLENGLTLLGYASQASFLLDNDLLGLAEAQLCAVESELERIKLARQVKQLTLPGEMGERFQVMALGKGYDLLLRGFRSQDLTHRL